MKKVMFASVLGLSLFLSSAYAEPARDWHDLEAVHKHVQEAIHEMAEARAKNHFDMAGHGEKAEELLKQAEHELRDAVESAKRSK